MDMHIEMSYCGFDGFRTLAQKYLGVDEHPLFDAVRELLWEVQITPADVAECLMTTGGARGGWQGPCPPPMFHNKKKLVV